MNTLPMYFLGKRNPSLTLWLAGVLAIVIFLTDSFAHSASAVMVFYSIVVMLVATVLSRRATLMTACVCIVATVIGYVLGHSHEQSLPAIVRASVAIGIVITVTSLTLRIQADAARLAVHIRDLKLTQSALNRTMDDLAHATRVTLLGELTASIAHEVTQPLAAIATAGDAGLRWLKRDKPDIPEACHAVETMIANARRASEIVRRVRSLASKRESTYTLFDLNALVVETIDLLGREIEKYGAVVKTDLTPGELITHGDRVQLQQVLINLAVNGLQAMANIEHRPRLLEVRLRVKDAANAVAMVRDSGGGIAPEVASTLFSAFQTTKEEGMGLGLSICRSIVEGHGGSIACAMSSPAGTTMQIQLPVAMNVLV